MLSASHINLNAQKLRWLPLDQLERCQYLEYPDWRWKSSKLFLTNRTDGSATCMNFHSLKGKAPCSCIIKNPRKAQMRNSVVSRFVNV